MADNVRIKVTGADIARAKRNDSFKCVVVQAVARTIPDAHHIKVDAQTIQYSTGAGRYVWLTPPAVQGYVIAFDAGDEPRPFNFVLRADQRLPVKRQRPTEVGEVKRRASQKANYRKRKAAKVQADPTSSPIQIAAAQENAARAETALAAVRAAYDKQPVVTTEQFDEPATSRVPTTFRKGRERHYGHRIMRINQEPRQETEA